MSAFFSKKKKTPRAYMPTKDKFWSQIGKAGSTSSKQRFQTPHHQQDMLIDLTDDNSPQVVKSTPEVVEKTIIKGNLGMKGSPTIQKEQPVSQDPKKTQESQANKGAGNPSQAFIKDEPMGKVFERFQKEQPVNQDAKKAQESQANKGAGNPSQAFIKDEPMDKVFERIQKEQPVNQDAKKAQESQANRNAGNPSQAFIKDEPMGKVFESLQKEQPVNQDAKKGQESQANRNAGYPSQDFTKDEPMGIDFESFQKEEPVNQDVKKGEESQENKAAVNPLQEKSKDAPKPKGPRVFIMPSAAELNKPMPTDSTPLTYLVGKPKQAPGPPKLKTAEQQKKIIPQMTAKQLKNAKKNKSKGFILPTPVQVVNVKTYHQTHQQPFFRAYPSGIPRSMLRQQEMAQMQQQATIQQLQQEQFQQQHQPMVPQANFQPNVYPQQPIAEPSWYQPQPTLAQDPMVPMQYNEAMPGFNPTPQTFVPPMYPMDQTPQLNTSEIYNLNTPMETQSEPCEAPESPSGQRLSAFKRLGPLTEPIKPKLIINLQCSNEQSFREVVDRTNEKPKVEPVVPVHLRPVITTSTDETVMRFLINWPWKKAVAVRKTVTAKTSKSAMLLEREQMEESYEKDNLYIQISVKGYPPTWKKEDVLDALLEHIYVIPCFIEFTPEECKFLVIRSRAALLNIHKLGFVVMKEEVVLTLAISVTCLSLNQIDFIPRLVLRKRLGMAYNGEDTLNLKSFTTKEDISHFIYFPLNSTVNQSELVEMQSVVAWEHLTSLDLSHNRMTSIDRFHLQRTTPKLKHLDLSHNKLGTIATLLRTRTLPLRSIKLEGNPLCHDYIDPAYYIKVIRMIYSGIREIDGIEVQLKGDFPKYHKNYCQHSAVHIVDKFLNVFFPLLDSPPEDRLLIDSLYDEKALISITYQHKYLMRQFRSKPGVSRYLDNGSKEIIEGAAAMTKVISKWPPLEHDPFTFTVDGIYHSDTSTIIRIDGILKITSETLAEDEHVIAFTRTVVLRTSDGVEYKIQNELLHWHLPSVKYANTAFRITKVRSKRLSLDFESTPDDDLKEKLTDIFMKITELDKRASERCLEKKDWNLRNALDLFIQLLKLDDLQSLTMDAKIKS